MCPPKIKKQAPAASTTPTMQAADELQLVTDGLQDNAIGRASLRTAGAAKGGVRTTKPSGTGAAPVAAAVAPSTAADALGLAPRGGRTPGARQDFYNPAGSVEP